MSNRLSASLLTITVALAACKKHENPEIAAKLVEVTPKAIVVEVKTKPGLTAGFGTTIWPGKGTLVGADGTTRISLPIEDASRWDGTGLQIVAEKRSTFADSWARVDLPMPCPTKAFARLSRAKGGAWFAFLGSEPRRSASPDAIFSLESDDEQKPPVTVWIDTKEKTVPLVIATPADAKVRIANRDVDVEPSGLTVVAFPLEELALGATMESLDKGTLRLPVRVSGESFTLALRPAIDLYAPRVTAFLGKRLRTVIDEPLKPGIDPVDAVLFVTPTDRVVHVGASGPAVRAKWVAIAQGTRRKGKSCSYASVTGGGGFALRMDYEDYDVRVVEAATGKEVAKRRFVAPTYDCPSSAADGDEIVGRPEDETITAWLEKGVEKAWK